MSTTAAGPIVCTGCRRRFVFKSELAGRRIKCKCGQPIAFPRRDIGTDPNTRPLSLPIRREATPPTSTKPVAVSPRRSRPAIPAVPRRTPPPPESPAIEKTTVAPTPSDNISGSNRFLPRRTKAIAVFLAAASAVCVAGYAVRHRNDIAQPAVTDFPAPNHTGALSAHVQDLQRSDSLTEARNFIAGGHQAAASPAVEAWYAAGCPNVWYEMTGPATDARRQPRQLIVQMPESRDRRTKVFEILKKYYKDRGIDFYPGEMNDTGEDFIQVGMK